MIFVLDERGSRVNFGRAGHTGRANGAEERQLRNEGPSGPLHVQQLTGHHTVVVLRLSRGRHRHRLPHLPVQRNTGQQNTGVTVRRFGSAVFQAQHGLAGRGPPFPKGHPASRSRLRLRLRLRRRQRNQPPFI